jgi:hypothetical protein
VISAKEGNFIKPQYEMLKLSIKGLRLIIVVVQVGAVKRKKERQDETQFITKIGGKTS